MFVPSATHDHTRSWHSFTIPGLPELTGFFACLFFVFIIMDGSTIFYQYQRHTHNHTGKTYNTKWASSTTIRWSDSIWKEKIKGMCVIRVFLGQVSETLGKGSWSGETRLSARLDTFPFFLWGVMRHLVGLILLLSLSYPIPNPLPPPRPCSPPLHPL